MNYFCLVELKKQINEQKLNVARAREMGTSITSELDDMPKACGSSNKIESSVEIAEIEERKLNLLKKRFDEEIKGIPNEYMKNIISCRLIHNWSWNKIATIICNGSKGNSVRMSVSRYNWVRDRTGQDAESLDKSRS